MAKQPITQSPLLRWKLLPPKRAKEFVASLREMEGTLVEDWKDEPFMLEFAEDHALVADLLEFLREAKHIRGGS